MTKIPTQLTDSQRVQCQILIQAHPLFAHLPLEASLEVANLFNFCEYLPDEIIVREDETADAFFFIAQGTALVSRTFSQIAATHLVELKAGNAIGLSDSGFYSKTFRRTATVTAKSRLKLFCLSIDKFKSYLEGHPDFDKTIHVNSQLILRIRFMKELSVLSHLSPASMLFLVSKIEEMTIPPDQFVLSENEDADFCYLLKSGSIEVLLNNHRLAILQPPAIFGEAALINASKRNASVKTLEECQLLKIDKNTLLKALEDNPAAAKEMIALIENRKRSRESMFHFTKDGWVAIG